MTQNQIAYHNAKELERHNQATERETSRHQQVAEALQKWSNALTNYQIAVNNAHYVRQDAETERANRARESQNIAALGETMRSNVANESIRRQGNAIQSASVAETSRHQKAMENIQSTLNASLIEKYGAETENTQEQTRSSAVYRTIIMPEEQRLKQSQTGLNVVQADTELTKQFVNVVSGFARGAEGINSIVNAGTSIFKLGLGNGGSNSSANFWKQLEVMTQ